MDRMLRFLGLRYATAALVLVALAALYGAASLSRPSATADAKGVRVPITSAVAVCPGHEGGRLSVQSAKGGPSGGHVDTSETRGGAPLASMTAAGQGWRKDTASGDESFTVRAAGGIAAGLEVEQTTHWPGGPDRGLAGARCASPGTDLWFLGPGPDAADALDLYLTNVDPQPASVDLTALSGVGPLDTTDGRATPVAPYSTTVVKLGKSPEGLGDILNTARDLALHVRTTSGRVAASLRVRIGEKKGIEWLPASPAPAASLVVPGVPGGSGERRLLVAVPGEADARVRVRVVGPEGEFSPQGQDVVDAPGKTVTPVDLGLAGKPGAVRVSADRPVVAAFTAERGADVAYGAATAPLGAPDGPRRVAGGVVADNRFDSVLTLTAPSRAASVQVTALAGQAPGTPQEIEVPAGRTVETKITVPAGGDQGFSALITPKPGSGPVYAARTMYTGKGDGFLFTVLPVVPASMTQVLPRAADSQTVLTP
ncbi:hypothetical protein AGRA3207_002954 [Actinomadura graeca]|uniref:Secreted protein n=1 Tax=Actinomadura graeca TaxID=2750812 RepID=A0ABX8QTA9_9ACTN|nr:DUF5719 family protein [Actinomadura graeca]QXJ22025.1 hypothetical protein AGRA3207_002954 [Actinomadura graeca]